MGVLSSLYKDLEKLTGILWDILCFLGSLGSACSPLWGLGGFYSQGGEAAAAVRAGRFWDVQLWGLRMVSITSW